MIDYMMEKNLNILPINPNYIKLVSDEIDDRKRYPIVLDIADTIYITNYILGYYSSSKNANEIMQFQKFEDLKKKKLLGEYQLPFKKNEVINGDDFGINVYFMGQPNDARKRQPDYIKLLDLTSSHINFGGWSCCDFVCTLTSLHKSIKLISEEGQMPNDEYVIGWIRVDSSNLNNKPLQEYLGQRKLMPDFINAHILNAKVIVPTAPFSRYFRGGKLLALISQSNEIRNFFNEKHGRNIVLWYTMSLWGSSKSSSQYDQLDRYIKFIGNTESDHLLRMKNPHLDLILNWLDRRGIDKSNFVFSSSSKSDRKFKSLVNFVKHCLWYNKKDPTVKELKNQFDNKVSSLESMTEAKRVYVSTYGMDSWDDNLINVERVEKEENNLENLFKYWKNKVFKKMDWGMRKNKELLNNPVNLEYELLNEEMDNFVR